MTNRVFIHSLMFMWLGFSLKALLNIGFENWEWWVVILPTVFIVSYQETKIKK